MDIVYIRLAQLRGEIAITKSRNRLENDDLILRPVDPNISARPGTVIITMSIQAIRVVTGGTLVFRER